MSLTKARFAGAATVAAGGTAAAVVGLTTRTSADSSNGSSLVVPGLAADATKSAADELKKPIEDPKVRAAHLLRRAGWGGSAAQIAEFAALDRETAADRLLNF